MLTPADLSIYDDLMQRVVEPGAFDVMVGTSSASTQAATLQVVSK
jgi:hypothetical protein